MGHSVLSEALTAKSCNNAPVRFVISVRPCVRFVLVLFVDAYSVTVNQNLENIFLFGFPHKILLLIKFWVKTSHKKMFIACFYFTLFTHWATQNLAAIHCNIVESTIIFQCSLHLCRQPPSNFEHAHVFSPGAKCSPSSEQGSSYYSQL